MRLPKHSGQAGKPFLDSEIFIYFTSVDDAGKAIFAIVRYSRNEERGVLFFESNKDGTKVRFRLLSKDTAASMLPPLPLDICSFCCLRISPICLLFSICSINYDNFHSLS